MKNKGLLSIVVATLFATNVMAQNKTDEFAIGLQIGTIEYNGEYANEIYSFATGIHPSLGLNIAKYMNPSFDVRGNFRVGMIDRDVFENRLFDINVVFDYKFANGYILKEDSKIAPYIFLGAADAISSFTDKTEGTKDAAIAYFNIPMGAGLKFNMTPKMAISLETHYNYALTDLLDGNASTTTKWDDSFLYNSLGFSYNFSLGKDSDGDGVKDKDDKCPNVAGPINGCPDSDGDGVADIDDKCPNTAGTINGCPDSDGDGVADINDKCPSIAGTEADGCPAHYAEHVLIMQNAQKGLFFNTGSSVIKTESYKVLDNIYTLLSANDKLKLDVSGHTDNTGGAALNLKLSKERAAAAKTYLVTKGIDASRITSAGFGDAKPVADNSTADGRKQNRRVEFKIKY